MMSLYVQSYFILIAEFIKSFYLYVKNRDCKLR